MAKQNKLTSHLNGRLRDMISTKSNKKRWIPIAVAVVLLIIAFASQIKVGTNRALAFFGSGAIFPTSVMLTHEQSVWLHALEWCESSGVKTAINAKDLDGTPSYFSFQFKPSTFKMYGIKYGLLAADVTDEEVKNKLDDYALQKKMVSMMIDDPKINWKREFPDCVRRLGRPPID